MMYSPTVGADIIRPWAIRESPLLTQTNLYVGAGALDSPQKPVIPTKRSAWRDLRTDLTAMVIASA